MSFVWSLVKGAAVGSNKNAVEDALGSTKVSKEMDGYDQTFDEKDLEKRSVSAQSVTDAFYNLVTDFYEYGWCQSFHFAVRFNGEAFPASIARHEHFLALRLGLNPGDKVLDAGCGVMGPARSIARFSGASITGLNINEYQVRRSEYLNSQSSVSDKLKVVQGDFMSIPFDDNTFDSCYAIEALVHAPNRVKVYKEVMRVIKPGAKVFFYEWVCTDKYDPTNATHRKIKAGIEYGNSICELGTTADVDRDLESAGFITEETCDLALRAKENGNDQPWYSTFQSGYSVSQLPHTPVGRWITSQSVSLAERCGVAPEGTVRAHSMLLVAAENLLAGGELGIFTPMYMVLARKPEE
eukprot:54734_1